MRTLLVLTLVSSLASSQEWIGKRPFQVFADHGQQDEPTSCRNLPPAVYSHLDWKPGHGCYATLTHPVKVDFKAAARFQRCHGLLAQWRAENLSLSAKELSLEQLNGRIGEMLSCEIDFPHDAEASQWLKQRSDYTDAKELRVQHFFERHKLWNEFLAEDERGER